MGVYIDIIGHRGLNHKGGNSLLNTEHRTTQHTEKHRAVINTVNTQHNKQVKTSNKHTQITHTRPN